MRVAPLPTGDAVAAPTPLLISSGGWAGLGWETGAVYASPPPAGSATLARLPPVRPVDAGALVVLPPSSHLVAPGDAFRDRFGAAIAASRDGTIAVACAPGRAPSGVCFVYAPASGAGWLPVASLIAAAPPGADFGAAVALSSDGAVIVVGAPAAAGAGGATLAGAAYVFVRTAGTNVWSAVGDALTDGATAAAGGRFGFSVAVSPDGTLAAVSAPFATGSTGAISTFAISRTAGGALVSRYTLPPDGSGLADRLGFALAWPAAAPGRLFAGAPGRRAAAAGRCCGIVAVLETGAAGVGTWRLAAELTTSVPGGPATGWRVAADAAGVTAAASFSTPWNAGQNCGGCGVADGSVDVYARRADGTWAWTGARVNVTTGVTSPIFTTGAASALVSDQFGSAVVLSPDGLILVVGAFNQQARSGGGKGDFRLLATVRGW